jgi:hypothetical protein
MRPDPRGIRGRSCVVAGLDPRRNCRPATPIIIDSRPALSTKSCIHLARCSIVDAVDSPLAYAFLYHELQPL